MCSELIGVILLFKVETMIAMFPKRIIEHGKRVNKDIMDQLDRVAQGNNQGPV